MRQLLLIPAAIAALASACSGSGTFIECQDNASCDRFGGGQCLENPDTGNQFCTYPDDECASGTRWSDLDVEDGISGECVGEIDIIDAGVDGPPPPDATPGSPMILGIELPARVAPGAGTQVTCLASDPDGDTLTYSWMASAGSITGTGDIVTWTTPATEQDATITCEVSDGGLMDSLTVPSTVLVTNGLVAGYWLKGDGVDFSGNGHDITIPGGMAFATDRFGQPNGALRFNGVNNFLTVPTESDFDLVTLTVVAIFKVTPSNEQRGIIGKGTGNGGGAFSVRVVQDDNASMAGYARFMWTTSGSGGDNIYSTAALSTAQFLSLTAIRTATNETLYLGDALNAQQTHGGTVASTNEAVTIGRDGVSTPGYFNGDIDEIRIYSRALGATEVAAIANGSSVD